MDQRLQSSRRKLCGIGDCHILLYTCCTTTTYSSRTRVRRWKDVKPHHPYAEADLILVESCQLCRGKSTLEPKRSSIIIADFRQDDDAPVVAYRGGTI